MIMLTHLQCVEAARFAADLDDDETILITQDGVSPAGTMASVITLTKSGESRTIDPKGEDTERPREWKVKLRGPRGGRYFTTVWAPSEEAALEAAEPWARGEKDGTKYTITSAEPS